MLDWDANVNPEFAKTNRTFPCPVRPFAETEPDGFREQWVCYGTKHYSAKELTVLPKRTVTMADAAAYGLIVVQGHGTFGMLGISAPTMIRFGALTEDELYVSEAGARLLAAWQVTRREGSMASQHTYPKLHNAMWPGLVGKGSPGAEPTIDLDTMLDLTASTSVDGLKFDGVDLFLFDPHLSIDASAADIARLAETIGSKGLAVGSLVAPVWPPTGG